MTECSATQIRRHDGSVARGFCWPCPQPRAHVLLVHGTAGHARCYDAFAQALQALGNEVHAVDLRGHGPAGDPRGNFRMEDWLADIRVWAEALRSQTPADIPIVLMGASQGGEVAFQAAMAGAAVDAIVCLNLLLPAQLEMRRGIGFMRGAAARTMAATVGDRLRVPLRRFVDFEAAYRECPGLFAERLKDPDYTWSYGFASYRSVFAYDPPRRAQDNQKPVLVCGGERDPIINEAHLKACFELVGGPKDLYLWPAGGHQPMMYAPRAFAQLVDDWVRTRVVQKRAWTPANAPLERSYRHFLADAKHTESSSEYELGPVDRVLARISNGRIDRGVEFFAAIDGSAFGDFLSEVVCNIDRAAWPSFAPHLPKRLDRVAVLGCGSGKVIEVLREIEPRLRSAQIVGVDVDPVAIARGVAHFQSESRVELKVQDARTLGASDPGEFDFVYAHGIFDHSRDHRTLLEAVTAALRPGGRFGYITPDRNILTWLRFVAVGPKHVFGLGHYAQLHDYRTFPRAHELDLRIADAGMVPLDEQGGVPLGDGAGASRALHQGVAYAASPLQVLRAVRRRDVSGLRFKLTKPKWWLGGYDGEYMGVAERPDR